MILTFLRSIFPWSITEVWTRVTGLGLESSSSQTVNDIRLESKKLYKTCNSPWTLTPMTRDW